MRTMLSKRLADVFGPAATAAALLLAGAGPATGPAGGVLAPPSGNVPFLSAQADGTQDYVCLPAADSPAHTAWRLLGPQAALSASGPGQQPDVAEHVLAAVPGLATTAAPGCIEAGSGTRQYCPSWRSPTDGSTVWGEKSASAAAGTGPSCPHTGSIACLLLKAVATGGRPAGLFSRTTFVQRLGTSGGSAPDTACTAGQVALVPYRATYVFYARRP